MKINQSWYYTHVGFDKNTFMTQHIDMDQLGQKFKTDFFAIPYMAILSAQVWCKHFWNQTLRSWDMVMSLMML